MTDLPAAVVPLEDDEALAFIEASCGSSVGKIGKKPQVFGIRRGDEITATAVFCNPSTREAQSAYTTELTLLEAQDESQVVELIRHFMSLPKTIDFFVSSEAFSHHTASFEAMGMSSRLVDGVGQVHEWHNPSFRSYTYRITSTADDSYYYGRHGTWRTDVESMLKDGYMGSGGVKFKNWVKAVGKSSLRKEILGIYETWGESVVAESELIGDSHKTDPRCKNSKPGGTGLGSYFPDHQLANCLIHGKSLHQGTTCKKCSSRSAYSTGDCTIHGETLFQGEKCCRCTNAANRSMGNCAIHGDTIHHGTSCVKCHASKLYSIEECKVHGEVVHMSGTCKSCVINKSTSVKTCAIHGEGKHIGDKCRMCITEATASLKDCPIHGEVFHQGSVCATCVGQKSISLKECKIHGTTKFKGSKCSVCATQKIVSLRVCTIHGETKYVGEHCKKCMAAKVWSVQECPEHGESKHRSGKCAKCAAKSRKPRSRLESN